MDEKEFRKLIDRIEKRLDKLFDHFMGLKEEIGGIKTWLLLQTKE